MNTISDPGAVAAENIPDKEVIGRVLAGETNLYAILVRRYNQRLYRVAVSVIDDEAEAEDAMQVAYIKAFENLKKFEYKSAFSTWLTRILINECLLRTKKRNQSLSMNDDMIENELQRRFARNPQTPLTSVVNSELKKVLENAICQLPEKYKTVFVMRELENMSVAETRECLNISEVNVKVRLNRAKAMLRSSITSLYQKEDLLDFHLTRCNRMTENVMREIEKLSLSAFR
jgi:RNA polymerase sigma-70 factor (ECF subfamily)